MGTIGGGWWQVTGAIGIDFGMVELSCYWSTRLLGGSKQIF